ncbi:hypothetical protein CRUP_015679 [Coryphaenoides rupestris]|nr:hypothetical protein CRUP_015679 [Coryphaenoides rupestris]
MSPELSSIPFFACELKAVTPHRRGFFCGDASITYPFVPREAIPDSLLIAGGIAITGLSSLTNMAKLSVGRLRPNFLSVCNVTYASLRCTPGAYVAEPPCQQVSKMVEEARYGCSFYLQARLSWRGARLLRPLVQFLLVMIAVYTGLSRISDYRHHPSDVVTGFVQGGLTAYWVVRTGPPLATYYTLTRSTLLCYTLTLGVVHTLCSTPHLQPPYCKYTLIPGAAPTAFHISSMFKPCVRPDLSPACTTLESPLSSQQTVC